jgi:acetaldehyde dehydrogenase (acetylating)
VGPSYPLSREKLTPVLGFIEEDGWRAGCERSIELLRFGGDGHSLSIHAQDEDVILAFGIEKPAFRILVNTWSTFGAIGGTTGLMPSMTLAPGGIGGAVVSDNITVHHLLNVKRVAYEVRRPPADGVERGPPRRIDLDGATAAVTGTEVDAELIAAVVRRVLSEVER